MAALEYVRRAGLAVELEGKRLRITPAGLITNVIRQFIRDHRVELLAELNTANDPQSAPDPTAPSLCLIFTAATATPAWLKARDHYLNHLMACRACHAPTNRYCHTAATQRAIYNAIPWS